MGKLILLGLVPLLAVVQQSHCQLTHSDFEGQALPNGKNSRSLESSLVHPPVPAPHFGHIGPPLIPGPTTLASPSSRGGLPRMVTILSVTISGVIVLMTLIVVAVWYSNLRRKPNPKFDLEEGKIVSDSGTGKVLYQYICWGKQVNPGLDQATEVARKSLREHFERSSSREWRPEAAGGTLARFSSREYKRSGIPSTEQSADSPEGHHEIDGASSAENSADLDAHKTPDFFQKVMSWRASSESPQEHMEV